MYAHFFNDDRFVVDVVVVDVNVAARDAGPHAPRPAIPGVESSPPDLGVDDMAQVISCEFVLRIDQHAPDVRTTATRRMGLAQPWVTALVGAVCVCAGA